ncbi:MAG TPA: hypothetical protein VF173_01070 [Thermoanaerobaculia bacterium]|nr:hypothetical protein [Thermoanaerobaculia bacterium]
MTKLQKSLQCATLVALALAFASGAALAAPPPCNVPNNGTGTVTLPPAGCEYLSPSQVHMIINGLPPGTTIILAPIHRDFICRQGASAVLPPCNTPGGPLGGETENFNSTAVFQVSGTGALAGWNRVISVPIAVQIASGPRTLGAKVQTFKNDMQSIQGGITGDADFASLTVVGGTSNGLSSPGQTTLTLQSNGTFNVTSSFTVGYRISFVGASGGRLAGLSGTTTGTVNMQAFQ